MVDTLPDEEGEFSGPTPIVFGILILPVCIST